MYNHPATVCLSIACSVLLAACGSGGGNSAPSPVQPPSMTSDQPPSMTSDQPPSMTSDQPPSMTSDQPPPPGSATSYMTYAEWNQQVRDAFPALASCTEACDTLVPMDTATIRSPFGETAAFDPAVDDWSGTWGGSISGYRHVDPDGDGTGVRRDWTGDAKLAIESTDLSRVRFWGENLRYRLSDHTTSTVSPDRIPQTRADAWVATLSTAAGQKGYFSGSGVYGQFTATRPGRDPDLATGHIHRDGHTGAFVVAQ